MKRWKETSEALAAPSCRQGVAWLALVVLVSGAAAAGEIGECESCHREVTPGIYGEWGLGRHFSAGVGCADCHGTDLPRTQGGVSHYGRQISILVSPLVCGRCHAKEAEEFNRSAHARAYECVSPEDCVEGGQKLISW